MSRLLAVLGIAAALVLGALLYRETRAREAAEMQAGLDAARVVSAIFTQRQDLRVATLHGIATAQSQNDGLLFHPQQVTRAPYSASYFVQLGAVGRGAYHWSPDHRTLTVVVPDVTVEPPAIDMARAQTVQRGVWISRSAGAAMQTQVAGRLASRVSAVSRSDANMARARAMARVAVARTVEGPLAAAGFGTVTVAVRFPWEGRSSDEQVDRSRSLSQVFGLSR